MFCVLRLIATCGFGLSAPIASAQTVVLSGNEDPWLAGDLVPEGRVLNPKRDKDISVIVGDEIVRVTWPQSLAIRQSQRQEDMMTLAEAVTGVRIAAQDRRWLRNGGVASIPPSIYSVQIGFGGKYCYFDAEQLQFWRPRASDEIDIQISDVDDKWDLFFEMPAGTNSVPWPPLPDEVDGVRKLTLSPDSASDLSIETEQIEASTSLDALLELAASGCNYQLFLLTRGLQLEGINGG